MSLTEIVFSIEELKLSHLGVFDVPQPRMYENIGPLKDIRGRMSFDLSGHSAAVVRVVQAQKAEVPANIDLTFSKTSINLGKADSNDAAKETYSVKGLVVEDLKKLAAMETAKNKANEFISLASKEGWKAASKKFEEQYGQKSKQNPAEANDFQIQEFKRLRRTCDADLEALAMQNFGRAEFRLIMDDSKKERQLTDKIYSLIPADANSPKSLPIVMEFKPDMAYLAIQKLTVRRLNENEFGSIKGIEAFKQDIKKSQSLAAVYFNPQDILYRTNYKATEDANKIQIPMPEEIPMDFGD